MTTTMTFADYSSVILSEKYMTSLKRKNKYYNDNCNQINTILVSYHYWLLTCAEGRSRRGMTMNSANSYTRTLFRELVKQDKLGALIPGTIVFISAIKEPLIYSEENQICHSRLHHAFRNFNKFMIFYNAVKFTDATSWSIFSIFKSDFEKYASTIPVLMK